MTRRSIAAILVLVLSSALVAAPPSGNPPRPRPRLFKDSRQSLAIARAQGRKEVSLLIAAKPAGVSEVAREAARLGGDVRYREDEVGYLRIRLPIDSATKLAELDAVESAAMDYDDAWPFRLGADGRPGAPALQPLPESIPPQIPAKWPPRLTDYPLQEPYSPIKDLGAEEFRAKHPTWDGRGVTIALLDGNLDLLLPEFQTAYTLDGKPIPKIADYLNVTDPRDDAEINPQWVDMKATVISRGGKVKFGGKTFRAPRPGSFRVGLFSERRFNMDSNAAYIDQDVDRDGNPKGDDGLFGVMWDEKTNDVWVDTNRNLDFTDEKAMTDYIVRSDVGVFGKDDPSTPVRDSIGFTVQTDLRNNFVSINVGVYQHATIIMGSVVGNREPKGRLQGVAPGARIVSMYYGVSNAHGLIEGLIAAFKHPLVDLVVLEQSVAIASLSYLLSDGTHPISVIAQRLIDRYQKLLFVPGDNSPAFAFVAEDGLAPGAVSVGGYQSKESYRVNWGFMPENDDNLHWGALAHGPSGAGALKPDLLAPSGQMSTDPGYRMGESRKGLYKLPPGYSVDGGTSTATPMAAGATALVVSAAKQSGVHYDAAKLKAAITGSARHIARLAAHEQGNGLIQVGAAYELLQKLQTVSPVSIESRGPVKTKLSHLLRTPNEGVGLYEREGWTAGQTGERTITLTRQSGPSEPMSFRLSWQGEEGVFSSPDSVRLPLGTPVSVPVKITAKKEGAHSATLSIDHPSIPEHVHRVLAAIVVPYRLTAENGYSIKTEVVPPTPSDVGVFVDVPPGTAALRFAVSAPGFYPTLIGPDRDGFYPCPFDLQGQTPARCAFANPQPGVWEINVASSAMRNFDPEAPDPFKPTPVTVTATAASVGLAVAPAPVALAADRSQPLALTLENRLGKVAAAAASVDLGSAIRSRATIHQGEQHMYEVVVPKGTTSLLARVQPPKDSRADLDLYVLDCTDPEKPPEAPAGELQKGNKSPMRPPPICAPAVKSAGVGAGAEAEVSSPKAGRWVIVVDAFSAPDGPVEYEYFDFFSHPGFGAVAAADLPEERAPATRWQARANAWAARLPESPRHLAARIVATSKDVTKLSGRFGQGDKELIPLGAAEVWFDAPPPATAAR